MFQPIEPKPDFPALERRLLDWWYQSGLVKKYLQKNAKSKKHFSFLDGPITANNPMGVHHAWGRTYKDLWQRFFNMRGFKQRFQNGFDNQGLWVEVEVEKELGFKSKKDIEKYGIEKFVNKCKERTLKFAKVQTEQSKRLGYFMDWDHSYFTMSEENNYTIWNFLKTVFEKGWLYKGNDCVPWCPRCGTAISQHEILTEEYQELTHKAVYIKYPINGSDENLLVWTTTPWTLLSNVAVAVNKDEVYEKYPIPEGYVWVMRKAVDRLKKEGVLLPHNATITDTKPGAMLLDTEYEGPFDELSRIKNGLAGFNHRVVAGDERILPVGTEEGTGLVHIAPGAGSEDFQLGKKEKLPVVAVIDEEANYLEGLEEFSGKNAKKHPEIIIDFLRQKENGRFFFKTENYTHRYPTCWRCKTELVWRVVDEWYIAMDRKDKDGKTYRQQMVEVAKKINWLPKWGLDRELDWLKNMHDWLISKKRYWGLALPIWECQKCGSFEVIGSREELENKAVEGWDKFKSHSPHRPWVDQVKIKCPQCGEVALRVADVGNPWLDAGIVPFSTLPEGWFPADFITESFPGQFKNWFYSLIAMSTALKKTNSFKTILGHALVRDEQGEEMHKSKGNAIEFNKAADEIGVDVMRWMYVVQSPEYNLNFGYHLADEARRRFHLLLWNIYNFFVTYANIDEFRVKEQESKRVKKNVLDKWVISKLNQLIQKVTISLDKYDAFTASHAIEDFVNDLSVWYVRRSRDRVGPTTEDSSDKDSCYQTLYEVLVTLVKLLAPFTPFLAEEIYKNLTGKESVHLEDWPKSSVSYINVSYNKQMDLVRKICEMGHAARKEKKIKVRQPLKSAKCKVQSAKLSDELVQLIKDELNVKKVRWIKTQAGETRVELDTQITPRLRAEGEARELIRQIQELRKKADCALNEMIIVYAPLWPKGFENYIQKQTLAKKLLKGKELKIKKDGN